MRKSPHRPVNNDPWLQALCSRLWASSGYLAAPSGNQQCAGPDWGAYSLNRGARRWQ